MHLPLLLIKQQATQPDKGLEVYIHSFFTSALYEVEPLFSHTTAPYSLKKSLGTLWTGSWVGPIFIAGCYKSYPITGPDES